MKVTTRKGPRAEEYGPMRGEFLSLMEFTNYQLSVVVVESLGLTKHSQEFQDWLVSTTVSLPMKIDLFNNIYRGHRQIRAFRKVLSRLQSLWGIAGALGGPSQADSRPAKSSPGLSSPETMPARELKTHLAELREIEDVIAYWVACVKRGVSPSISADDFVDSVS